MYTYIMKKTTRLSMVTLKKRRQAKLQALAQQGPLLAGSLSKVERKDKQGKVGVYHLLTFKEQGKTRSVYVPKAMVKEVQGWIRNHRALKKKLEEISRLSVSIIQRHVPEKRAGAAGKRKAGAP